MEMKVGELAKSTELSVRTLHHYDEIGLLKPSGRTESGHRVYAKADVIRLHRIIALRRLGLTLDEIGKVIGESIPSLKETFDKHVESIESEIEEKKSTLRMLKGALFYIDLKDDINTTEMIETIREFSLHSKYYSKEQLEELEEQEKKIGVSGVKDAINEWPTLIQKVRSQMESGVNPSDIKLKPLVQRWIDLKNMFSGGNPQIEESTRKMYEENPDMAKRYQLDPSIFEYVQKAVDAHKIV